MLKFSFSFQFDSNKLWTIEHWNVKFYMKLDYNHCYRLGWNTVCNYDSYKHVVILWNFEVTYDEFSVDRIHT